MWRGWEHGGRHDLPGRLQLQRGFPDSETKPELFCLKSFFFLTCNCKLVAIYVHITQLKYGGFLKWSRSLIFSSPGVMTDSLSLKKGLELFSRKDMHLLRSFGEREGWLSTILYRKSDLIWFKQNWFLLLLLPHTGPELSAYYFLVWLTETVGFGARCHVMENSVSLPQSPPLGIFVPVGHRKHCTAMITRKSQPQEWRRSSPESQVRSCPRHHFTKLDYSWRKSIEKRVRKSIAVWRLSSKITSEQQPFKVPHQMQ